VDAADLVRDFGATRRWLKLATVPRRVTIPRSADTAISVESLILGSPSRRLDRRAPIYDYTVVRCTRNGRGSAGG